LRSAPIFTTMGIVPKILAGVRSYYAGQGFTAGYPQQLLVRDIADHFVAYGIPILLFSMVEGDDDDDEKPFLLTGTRGKTTDSRGEYLLNKRNEGPMMFRGPGFRWDYSRLEPGGTAIAVMVDGIRGIKRLHQGGDFGEQVGKFASVLLARIQSQPMLKSVGTFTELLDHLLGGDWGEAGEHGGRFLRDIATSYVPPNFWTQMARNLDDYQRADRGEPGWKRWLYDAVPAGEFWGIQPEIDLWGNPVTKQLSGGPQKAWRVLVDTGLKPSMETKHRFDRFLQQYMWLYGGLPEGVSLPTGTGVDEYIDLSSPKANALGQVKMTPLEKRIFRERVGRQAAITMARLVTNEDLARPTEERLIALLKELHKIDDDVRDAMFPSHRGGSKLTPTMRRVAMKTRGQP